MESASGTYRGGHVELDAGVDWPEGARVSVAPLETEIGLREEDWPDTPENRAALLARLQAIEPLEFTPEEEAEWEAARKAIRDYTLKGVRRQMALE